MGIDRIGKGGAPPSPVAVPDAPKAEPAASATPASGVPFDVYAQRREAARAEGPAPAVQSPLAQLREGKIDVDRYVDLKVEEATSHLGSIGKKEIEAIRSILRAQVASDPSLAELVADAARRPPSKPPEV